MKKVAFIGLGIMGFPMASHLKNKGFEVSVWNRNFAKSQKFVAEVGGFTSQNIKEVVEHADVVIMCLGNDASVREITNSFLKFMKKGAVLVDSTTASAELARELYIKCKEHGIDFLDAPLTGGQGGAVAGTLCVMCGGEEEVFNKTKPVFESYGTKIEYFGKAGSGQIAKMANQICIAGIIQSLAEGVNFAEKAGIDANKLFKLVQTGAGGSWQMINRHEWMLKKNFKENEGFPVEWMVKDLEICLHEAKYNGAKLPIAEEIKDLFKKVATEINPRIDTSSLILLLNNNSKKDI